MAWILPVPKSDAVVIWPAPEIEDDSENDETGDGDDFDRCEYELAFAIYP